MAQARYLHVSEPVRHALHMGQPVVALETAVATHGLPRPQNIHALAAMEAEILATEAVPAICLAQGGCLLVGATLRQVAEVDRDRAKLKASVRDLGPVIARGYPAGLTVSATLFAAQAAGVRVFATGGIGGVHLGAERSGDVSADLHQLARSQVITVCSGAKSVLDIPRTLEYLETLGVPAVSYRTALFPAFYLMSSGVATTRVDSPEMICRMARVQWELGQTAGLVVGNPVPAAHAVEPEAWKDWVVQALESAEGERVQGKDTTPYLLRRVAELSGGKTVEANLALLRHNARLAAEIATALVS